MFRGKDNPLLQGRMRILVRTDRLSGMKRCEKE